MMRVVRPLFRPISRLRMKALCAGATALTLSAAVLSVSDFFGRFLASPLSSRSIAAMAEARGSRCLGNPSWQQTMLRIKNPKDSVKHYEEEYGMRCGFFAFL
eukprot:848761-Amorphochlora_amoeboformis.AAC.1